MQFDFLMKNAARLSEEVVCIEKVREVFSLSITSQRCEDILVGVSFGVSIPTRFHNKGPRRNPVHDMGYLISHKMVL